MMEHKAFIFDFDGFENELCPLIQHALRTDNCSGILEFICNNMDSLVDPYEGEQLQTDWEEMIEVADPHQYGDFALTKYYDPTQDIGLGLAWEVVQDHIDPNRTTSPILGTVVGEFESPFEPGKLGAYFQSRELIAQNLDYVQKIKQCKSSADLDNAIRLLQVASSSEKGLYVTF